MSAIVLEHLRQRGRQPWWSGERQQERIHSAETRSSHRPDRRHWHPLHHQNLPVFVHRFHHEPHAGDPRPARAARPRQQLTRGVRGQQQTALGDLEWLAGGKSGSGGNSEARSTITGRGGATPRPLSMVAGQAARVSNRCSTIADAQRVGALGSSRRLDLRKLGARARPAEHAAIIAR